MFTWLVGPGISLSKWPKPSKTAFCTVPLGEDHPDLLPKGPFVQMVSMQPSHGLRGNQPASLDTGTAKTKTTTDENRQKQRGRRREQSQETEAKEEKDFVYPWHWHRPEMGRCTGEEGANSYSGCRRQENSFQEQRHSQLPTHTKKLARKPLLGSLLVGLVNGMDSWVSWLQRKEPAGCQT